MSNESDQQSIGMVVERMFQRYHLVLMKYLRDRLFNKQEAEDVAQEVYYRIARRTASDQIDFPKAFLIRTARNLLIDMRRAAPKNQLLLSIDSEEDIELITTIEDETIQENPESEISAEQLLSGIKAALAELNPKCQAVFVMNRVDGISYRQIAKDLNMSESMVGKYMRQALRHLMQTVEVEL